MKNRNVAEIVIFNEKGEILFQKKTIDYPTLPGGYWSFFGGEVEPGEDALETIKREVREEIGIEIDSIRLIGEKEYKIEDRFQGKEFVFEGKFSGKISDIRITEGGGFAFFDISELKSVKIMDMELNVLKEFFNIKL